MDAPQNRLAVIGVVVVRGSEAARHAGSVCRVIGHGRGGALRLLRRGLSSEQGSAGR